jgi:delta 1-pyrroline-5-carboxylate dehydrogenase
MRFEKRQILCCCLVLFLLTTFGCRKKGGQTTSGTGTKAPAPAQAASVDTEKPVSEIQTQAQTMTVDSLKATALKYKEAIVAKQADIEKLTAKIKEIPVAEALGEEAKTLKADLATLETNLKALKDRFQVYYDTLKQKGGDVSNLTL